MCIHRRPGCQLTANMRCGQENSQPALPKHEQLLLGRRGNLPSLLMLWKAFLLTPLREDHFQSKPWAYLDRSSEWQARCPTQPVVESCWWPWSWKSLLLRGEEALTASVGLQSQRWSTACSRSEGKAGLEPIKAVGQNSSYYAVIWNCLEDMIYFGLYWFQLV